jgi:hypothetical protein
MVRRLPLMHAVLHFISHALQPLHLLLSILILKMENLLRNPKMVPTGQIVLQYVRPFEFFLQKIAFLFCENSIQFNSIRFLTFAFYYSRR